MKILILLFIIDDVLERINSFWGFLILIDDVLDFLPTISHVHNVLNLIDTALEIVVHN